MKTVRVSNTLVAAVLAGLLIPDIALILAYSLGSGVQATLIVVDRYRPAFNYIACIPGSSGPALLWTVFAWHVRSP